MSTPIYPDDCRDERAVRSEPLWPARELEWLGAWCLLEPLVGVLWQWAFARSLGHALHAHHALLLGSGLWLVYLGDHWLDGLRMAQPQTARHRWVVRHRHATACLWTMVLLGALTLAVVTLTAREWLVGGALLAGTAGYFTRVHARVPRLRHKEVLVALVYTGGITSFCWETIAPLAIACVIPFGALVLLNLAVIVHKERDVDRHHGLDFVTRAADLPVLLRWTAWGLLTGTVAASLLLPRWSNWFLCVAASATGLLWLHKRSCEYHRDDYHLLADAVLLTPSCWLAVDLLRGA